MKTRDVTDSSRGGAKEGERSRLSQGPKRRNKRGGKGRFHQRKKGIGIWDYNPTPNLFEKDGNIQCKKGKSGTRRGPCKGPFAQPGGSVRAAAAGWLGTFF